MKSVRFNHGRLRGWKFKPNIPSTDHGSNRKYINQNSPILFDYEFFLLPYSILLVLPKNSAVWTQDSYRTFAIQSKQERMAMSTSCLSKHGIFE